jgi:hypothetical protein
MAARAAPHPLLSRDGRHLTRDVGGTATTEQFTNAGIAALGKP